MLQTIPGVNENCAATILAEIGPTVTAFTSDAHLASWAGLCPGSYESAGIKKSSHITLKFSESFTNYSPPSRLIKKKRR